MGSVLPSSLPFLGNEGHTIDALGDTVFNIYQTHISPYPEALLKSSQPERPPQRRVPSKKLLSVGCPGCARRYPRRALAPASLFQMRGHLGT